MEEPHDYYSRAETDTAHQEIVDNMTTQFVEMKKSLDENLNTKVAGLEKKIDQVLRVFDVVSTAVKWTDESTDWLSRNLKRLYPIFILVVVLWAFLKFGWVAVVHSITDKFINVP